jgi:putative transposase
MSSVAEISDSEKVVGFLKVNEKEVCDHLSTIVRDTVEETLNGLLEAEADELCRAKRYERSPERVDTRAGHYERTLLTKAGEVKLEVPRLRSLPFETEIIERYRRREASVEEALIEMYLAGVSVRRVKDITEALWGSRVSASTVSELNQKIYATIEAWRNRPIEGHHAYVYLDGIWLKRSWGGEVQKVSVLVAIGVDEEGYREILGVCEGAKEDLESWRNFLRYLKDRGLRGVKLFISDKCLGLIEALGEFYPEARWQRCVVHWYRNVLRLVPKGKAKEVAAMLKAIHAQEDRQAALKKAEDVAVKLEALRLEKAAALVRESVAETLSYMVSFRQA